MAFFLICRGDVQTQTIHEATPFQGTFDEAKTQAMNSVSGLPDGQEMIVAEVRGFANETKSSDWTDL